MENSTRVPATIMVDLRAGEETLQGIEEKLMQIQKSGFHVPMIFLCVAGSSNPQAVQSVQVPEVIAERWIRVVRLMLELQQPIYGMATGTMSPFGIMLLEACDCVLADTLQEGVQRKQDSQAIGDGPCLQGCSRRSGVYERCPARGAQSQVCA